MKAVEALYHVGGCVVPEQHIERHARRLLAGFQRRAWPQQMAQSEPNKASAKVSIFVQAKGTVADISSFDA